MLEPGNNDELPPIPGKRYFTIGEVSDLCAVKPHVLRYWEQEFPQLKPVKRRGNRRYYQRDDVLTIRQIRSLLYDQGYTIGGARQRMTDESGKGSGSVELESVIKETIEELEDLLKVLKPAGVLWRNDSGAREAEGLERYVEMAYGDLLSSPGRWAQRAVMKSTVSTARRAMTYS